MREQGRKWRERNPERAKKIIHDHYQRHKARKLTLAKQWRKDNPEKANAIQRRWRASNPDLFAAQKERERVTRILRDVAVAKAKPSTPSPAVSRLVEKAAARAQGARYGYQGAINADRR
ncbi:MAG TPA: hypothetical protein VK465_07045 [Fibrobacteria bacterium]|nr:hypothetical protein [Fibrobacteria bacterium]